MRRRTALASARKAAGYTQESLAAALHTDRSTVNRWESGAHEPSAYVRPKLARLLGQSRQRLQEMIDCVIDTSGEHANIDFDAAFEWLDQHGGWSAGSGRRRYEAALKKLDRDGLGDQIHRRSKVSRSSVVEALAEYYRGQDSECFHLYRARNDDCGALTSIVTRRAWQDLECPLVLPHSRLTFDAAADAQRVRADDIATARAVQRLAELATLDMRLRETPIFRLLDFTVQGGAMSASFGLGSFIEYALTADLLEGELLDAVARKSCSDPRSWSLRDLYLPDLEAVVNTSARLCAGGALALCAIARPADIFRGPADYLLLIQERSADVLNAARQLAVIPKGFHKPLTDYTADAQVSATLRRKLEEELFGRKDVDSTMSRHTSASPMHPSRLSGPMRWLAENPDALRMECTGFGLNLVSGNYEFPVLLVIDDEEFWARHGGDIETNWEAAGLQLYSSLDRELINKLISDERWSNEGLFALLQGLRRLDALGGKRVNLPRIELF